MLGSSEVLLGKQLFWLVDLGKGAELPEASVNTGEFKSVNKLEKVDDRSVGVFLSEVRSSNKDV